MKIGFISNLRAPYRTLQLNEFSKIENIEITAYYTNKKKENRNWETDKPRGFNEIDLNGIKLSQTYGYINKGLINIVRNNELIMLGGYEQPTMIALSFICRLYRKPYILLFDGISCDRLEIKEKGIKKYIKSIVINNSVAIMANGTIGRRYFTEQFNYPKEKIVNQYLAVDNKKIEKLFEQKETFRKDIRKKLGINKDDKVLIYSGRLIEIKNVEAVIKAISIINREDLVFLITGGGILEKEIKELAKKLGVKVIITGFIKSQNELFKHYFAGDALILPSKIEPWGLVINEALAVGLPILVSNICGCSLDLVKENGYIINPYDLDDIKEKIIKLFYKDDIDYMGKKSKSLMKIWSFQNSKKELISIINKIKSDF